MWKLTNTVEASVTLTVQLTAGKSQMVTCHVCVKEQIRDIENSKQDVGSSHRLSSNIVREVSGDSHGNGSSSPASNEVADGEVTQRTVPI